ncbi:MAG: response regulator transcription factor [Caldilineaceae bacterium]
MSKNMNHRDIAWEPVFSPLTRVEKAMLPLQLQQQSTISIATINVSGQFFQAVSDALIRTHTQVTTTMVNWRSNQFPVDQPVDIVVIDIDSSPGDSADFLMQLSAQTRIIVLSEICAAEQIIDSYAYGVDDYITKPCTHQEIAIRIAVLIRRLTWSTARPQLPAFPMDGVIANTQAHKVVGGEYLIRLSPIEFQLLNAFMRKPNEALKGEELFRQVWGYEVRGFQKLLDLAIQHLRQKIESAHPCPGQIQAIGATHYQFCPSEPVTLSTDSPLLVYT